MLADIFLGGVGFGAIGFLFAKIVISDNLPDKMLGGLVGFGIGIVIMAVGKITDGKRKS